METICHLRVESVEWIPETAAQRVIAGMDDAAPPVTTTNADVPKGRLFIYFIHNTRQ